MYIFIYIIHRCIYTHIIPLLVQGNFVNVPANGTPAPAGRPVYMCVYIYIYINTYVYSEYIYLYLNLYLSLSIYIYIYIYVFVYINACAPSTANFYVGDQRRTETTRGWRAPQSPAKQSTANSYGKNPHDEECRVEELEDLPLSGGSSPVENETMNNMCYTYSIIIQPT